MQIGNEIWGRENEDKLARVFSALEKFQMGPAFGSRPIHWYQIHMGHALDVLTERLIGGQVLPESAIDKFGALAHGEVRVRDGQVEGRVAGESRWRPLGLTPREVYNEADKRSRK